NQAGRYRRRLVRKTHFPQAVSGRRFDVIATGTALGRTVAFGPRRISVECWGAGRSDVIGPAADIGRMEIPQRRSPCRNPAVLSFARKHATRRHPEGLGTDATMHLYSPRNPAGLDLPTSPQNVFENTPVRS